MSKDLVIEAIEEMVKLHPEETEVVISYDSTGAVSINRILKEMKEGTEWGREQYKSLIMLTVDLIMRKELDLPKQKTLDSETPEEASKRLKEDSRRHFELYHRHE